MEFHQLESHRQVGHPGRAPPGAGPLPVSGTERHLRRDPRGSASQRVSSCCVLAMRTAIPRESLAGRALVRLAGAQSAWVLKESHPGRTGYWGCCQECFHTSFHMAVFSTEAGDLQFPSVQVKPSVTRLLKPADPQRLHGSPSVPHAVPSRDDLVRHVGAGAGKSGSTQAAGCMERILVGGDGSPAS